MINTIQKSGTKLSTGKVVLHSAACIAIFVALAIICDLATLKIPNMVTRVVVRELLLRAPLTIWILHTYSRNLINVYDPSAMYGKFNITDALKWTGMGFAMSFAVWLFYYLFHFAVVLHPLVPHDVPFQIALLTKWTSISIAAGLTEEVLFRGHLFMIIRDKYGDRNAILATSAIFGAVHIAMLPVITPRDILLVLIGGIVTGIMFTAVYMHSRSIWCAAIVHSIWDVFFIGKVTTIANSPADAAGAIAAFRLTSKNLLLTGGNFGIETGLPAFMCYLALTIAIFISFRKRRSKNWLLRQAPQCCQP